MTSAKFEVDSRALLELVRTSDCSAYDCEFIASAMQLKCKLVTTDGKLVRAFPVHAVSLAGVDNVGN